MQFKKPFIIFAFFLCLFKAYPANADTFIEAIQVECIPELYHLVIRSHTVAGEAPVEYFEKHRDSFEKSLNIFDLSDVIKTHKITCSPPDGDYEVIIQPTYTQDENRTYVATRTAIITVIYNGETLIDKLLLYSQKKGAEDIRDILFKTHEGYYSIHGYTYPDSPCGISAISKAVWYKEK